MHSLKTTENFNDMITIRKREHNFVHFSESFTLLRDICLFKKIEYTFPFPSFTLHF